MNGHVTPELFYTHGKKLQYPSERRMGYCSACVDTAKKKKIFAHAGN